MKCESLLYQLGSDILVNGYRDPVLEGTNVILECSSPNLILIGPDVQGMENGNQNLER